MAKIHQNADKFPIQWNGDVVQVGKDQQNDNIPASVNVTWNAGRPTTPYVACWDDGNGGVDGSQCTADVDSYFFEDFENIEIFNFFSNYIFVNWISYNCCNFSIFCEFNCKIN